MSQPIPEGITFSEAISHTQSLLKEYQKGNLSNLELKEIIIALVKTQDGARGFFVTYLTGENPIADSPSDEVISALQSSPEIVSELLVKNLAMSAAMTVTHSRNQDQEAVQGSQQVYQRTLNLIQKIQLEEVEALSQQLYHSLATGKGLYADFLNRWGYDEEQRQTIQQKISPILPHS